MGSRTVAAATAVRSLRADHRRCFMATRTKTASIFRLSDTRLRVADRASDVRGRRVVDSAGEQIGRVHDLLLDERESKVRFLEVASGGLFGLGETKFLIPVDAVVSVSAEAVGINQTRQRVASAPRYDPDLVNEGYYRDVYGYYGYAPWAPRYVYPRYPHYNM
jgi:sporulation protein YlmC with PRC-barrel domain